jgi:hypothetical protein
MYRFPCLFFVLWALACKAEPASEMMMRSEEKNDAPLSTVKEAVKDADIQTAGIPRERMIIRTAELSIEVRSHDETLSGLQRIARESGGFISHTTTELVYSTVKQTHVTLRIPSSGFDTVIVRLRGMSDKIEHESIQGQDVTEEFVDIDARLSNKRAEEEQLLLILKRSGSVSDILEVQRELFRVREEIERTEGRQRYLKDQISMATIGIRFHEPYPAAISRHGGFWATLGQGFEDGFYGFANVLGGTITVLIAGSPIFAVFAVGIWLLMRALRRRKVKS